MTLNQIIAIILNNGVYDSNEDMFSYCGYNLYINCFGDLAISVDYEGHCHISDKGATLFMLPSLLTFSISEL